MNLPDNFAAEAKGAVAIVPREDFIRMATQIEAMATSDLIAMMIDHEDLAAFCATQPSWRKSVPVPLFQGLFPKSHHPTEKILSAEDKLHNLGLLAGSILLVAAEIDFRIPTPPDYDPGTGDPYDKPCRGRGLPWDDRPHLEPKEG